MKVGVVAHAKKRLRGRSLSALRPALEEAGVSDPLWAELESSRDAPRKVRKLLHQGAELILVWGGDGSVQRSIDALVSEKADVPLGILPAGTANLLATNLGLDAGLEEAIDNALNGARMKLDVGRMNGEHFGVMAGLGFDARMIEDARKSVKKRLGKAAYVWTALKNLRHDPTRARITVDGKRWYKGPASLVLCGNVGGVLGGVKAFPDASPVDGLLEIGVVSAESVWQWARVATRTLVGDPKRSPLVELTSGERVEIELEDALPCELDGGARDAVKRAKVRAKRHAITVCVPRPGA